MKLTEIVQCNENGFLKTLSNCSKVITFLVFKDLALDFLEGVIEYEMLKEISHVITYCIKNDKEKILYIYNALSGKCFKYKPTEDFEFRAFHASLPIVSRVGKRVTCIRDFVKVDKS